ncbi:MAG: serine hydrolase domain-containing protein [Bacteroidota bacterium]
MKGPLFLFVCFVSISISLSAQKPNTSKLDKVLEKLEQRNQLMGSLAFSKQGISTYAKAFGYSDIGSNAQADTLTQYRIGSVSKMLTSTMVLQLVSEGKLQLSDSIAQFFPDWPNANTITIEHILRHESGIFNFGTSSKPITASPQSREEIIAVFEQAPVAFAPGTQVDYNNANYVVLSLIIEEIDQRSFAESLQDRILTPLSLNRTHAGGPIQTGCNEAHSYFWKNQWIKNRDNYHPSLLGAGALVSTPKELNVFLHALFTQKLLPAAQLKRMMTLKENMGMGLFAFPFYGKTAYGHSGNIDAFESFAVYFPANQVSFSLCLNGNRKEVNEVLIACLRAYFGK